MIISHRDEKILGLDGHTGEQLRCSGTEGSRLSQP